ncbi:MULTISPECIES: DUF4255 domain-containing protein [unclassified Streptomyces]|uniref:DUF4255 domain-containing protein n=1 Tax=unclassified Streptomyces TaxID=2593676 RepID=UPI00226F10AE|nr:MULTISPECIES: DUF4255 domain-containing protein [unclassified Streptomyces]MCY0924153.1 DUF4255 domain-containing protein [Streptomyces sp. H27-G5]MCY0962354.1 DUF4255 domain-containing protein [Streptomyces sp. H27-H5]
MINWIDSALKEIAESAGTGCETIQFCAPTREWVSNLEGTAVNLFLYDIRQDLTRSCIGKINVFPDGSVESESGKPIATHEPPMYLSLSYMITVWADGSSAEEIQTAHAALGKLVPAFARNRVLNVPEWPPHLARLEPEATMEWIAPLNDSRALTDLWSALDNTLMPSVNVRVCLPIESFILEEIDDRTRVASREIHLSPRRS